MKKGIHGSRALLGLCVLLGVGLFADSAHAQRTGLGISCDEVYPPPPFIGNVFRFVDTFYAIDISMPVAKYLCAPQGFAGSFDQDSGSVRITLGMNGNGDYEVYGHGPSTGEVDMSVACIARSLIPTSTIETESICNAFAGTEFTLGINAVPSWITGLEGTPSNFTLSGLNNSPGIGGGDCAAGSSSIAVSFGELPIQVSAVGPISQIGPMFGTTSVQGPSVQQWGETFCFIDDISGPFTGPQAMGWIAANDNLGNCHHTLEEINCSGSSCPNVVGTCIQLNGHL